MKIEIPKTVNTEVIGKQHGSLIVVLIKVELCEIYCEKENAYQDFNISLKTVFVGQRRGEKRRKIVRPKLIEK